MLLIGISSILLPLGINTVQAASVQIKDDARVLDVDQVHNTASKLSHPVSISTVRTFNGPKSDFVRSMDARNLLKPMVVMQEPMAIILLRPLPLSSRYKPAWEAVMLMAFPSHFKP